MGLQETSRTVTPLCGGLTCTAVKIYPFGSGCVRLRYLDARHSLRGPQNRNAWPLAGTSWESRTRECTSPRSRASCCTANRRAAARLRGRCGASPLGTVRNTGNATPPHGELSSACRVQRPPGRDLPSTSGSRCGRALQCPVPSRACFEQPSCGHRALPPCAVPEVRAALSCRGCSPPSWHRLPPPCVERNV